MFPDDAPMETMNPSARKEVDIERTKEVVEIAEGDTDNTIEVKPEILPKRMKHLVVWADKRLPNGETGFSVVHQGFGTKLNC